MNEKLVTAREPASAGPGARLSWREKISYGVGDLACSMIFNFMSSYLFYFYTDVAGIAVAFTGTVISAARLVDAFANPLVGILSDKTASRWGKLRPYLLFSAAPLALSTVAVFLVPRLPAGAKTVYALVTYTLFCLLYTVCNVPYTALMANITENTRERSHLNMTKVVSASAGSLISMGLALPLISLLGGGKESDGFLWLSILFAAITVVLILVSFRNTRERIVTAPQKLSFKLFAATARKSQPWIILCIGQMCIYIGTTAKNSSTLYYAKYCLGASDFAGVLLSLGSFTTIICAFLLPSLVVKFRKKILVLAGQLLFILSCLLTFFAGDNLVLLFLYNLIGAVGTSFVSGLSFLILGETIDHSEYMTGVRQQGLFTSVMMFTTKLGIVVSGAITAFTLSAGGYQADARQSPQALSAIQFNYIFLPIIASLIGFFVFCFYNLDRHYAKINQALQEKRRQGKL